MHNEDTANILKECNAGVKMGVDSINDVMDYVHSDKLKQLLTDCKHDHVALNDEIQSMLDEYGDGGKDPNPIAKGMSWVKTNAMLVMNESDSTIADLMTDGCNMGVKSLHKYLNQYEAAEEKAKRITKRLINIEEELAIDIRSYL